MSATALMYIRSKGTSPTRVMPLESSYVRVGRGPRCEVWLSDDGVADVQCILRRRGTVWYVQNVGPAGQVSLQGRAVRQELLLPGAALTVGDYTLVLRNLDELDGAAAPPRGSPDDLEASSTADELAPIELEPDPIELEDEAPDAAPNGIAAPGAVDDLAPPTVHPRDNGVNGRHEADDPAGHRIEEAPPRLSRWRDWLQRHQQWLPDRQHDCRGELPPRPSIPPLTPDLSPAAGPCPPEPPKPEIDGGPPAEARSSAVAGPRLSGAEEDSQAESLPDDRPPPGPSQDIETAPHGPVAAEPPPQVAAAPEEDPAPRDDWTGLAATTPLASEAEASPGADPAAEHLPSIHDIVRAAPATAVRAPAGPAEAAVSSEPREPACWRLPARWWSVGPALLGTLALGLVLAITVMITQLDLAGSRLHDQLSAAANNTAGPQLERELAQAIPEQPPANPRIAGDQYLALLAQVFDRLAVATSTVSAAKAERLMNETWANLIAAAHAARTNGYDKLLIAQLAVARLGPEVDRRDALVQDAVEAAPRDAGALSVLGGLFLDRSELETALAYYRQGLELDPNQAAPILGRLAAHQVDYDRYAERIIPDTPTAHVAAGNALSQQGLKDRADQEFDRARRAGRDSGRLAALAPPELVAIAQAYAVDETPESSRRAERFYRMALAREPGRRQWRLELAQTLKKAGEYAKAVTLCDEIIQTNPSFRDPISREARKLRDQSRELDTAR